MRRALLLVPVAAVLVTAILVVPRLDPPSCVGGVGFDWPNAGRVYLGGMTQKSTDAAHPERPLVIAAGAGLPQVRVFLGLDAAITSWRQDRGAALAAADRLVADAAARHVRLVLSNYPDLPMVTALAGHAYPSWTAAQRDLVTPGSVPYVRFGQWLTDIVARLGADPAVAAWEVVNEPGYMLGLDDGSVPVDVGLAFVGHFADLLHRAGARTVAGGGRPVFDPERLTDAQLRDYADHIDVLDDHLYPATATGADRSSSTANARALVDATAAWFDRARRVADRPDMPAMLGEVGSQPLTWFTTVQSAATQRGWPALAWGFDAYDANDFTDVVRPEALLALEEASRAAAAAGGRSPVLVGDPRC